MNRSSFGMAEAVSDRPVPRLILLPGLDGTGLLFEPLLRWLTPELHSTVISYPGDQPLGYDELLDYVLARLPDDAPYVLLGESFGGPLAIRIASTAPRNLCGLILSATFVRKPVRWLPRWIGPWLPTTAFRLVPWWGQLRILTSGKSTPELRRLFHYALSQVQPRVMVHRLSEVLRVDVVEKFQRLDLPILALAGRFDRTVPPHNLQMLQRLRSDLQIEIIECDHLLLQVEPETTGRIISRFVVSCR